jgi:16S rRNA (adenine1518-N6/adenine1519-N6)-dimethyltransferase
MKTAARLGQHFLKHGWAARALAYAAKPQNGEIIVEVGPGKGILTRELLALGPVVAVEKDEALVALLKETFAEDISSGRLTLIEGDVRDVTPAVLGVEAGKYVVAANIPYYITGEIIRQFLSASEQPRAMALLIQKEVAQRITSNKESILSLSVKAYGIPKMVEKVSRTHFSPPPSVDSAIILIDGITRDFFSDITEEDFFAVVRAGFASKRKQLANNLSTVFGREAATAAMGMCGISDKARAEDIHVQEWKGLVRTLRS